MLSSDLNKLADSYAQIASEAIDPKGAARMDASKGETAETEDETNKRLMLGKYSPGSKKKKTNKCTSESFYLKRLQAMNPVFAEQYLAIAEILIEDGYENSRLIDNIVEAFPPEMVGYEFISALKAVNPRLHENLQSTEKRQAKAIVMHFSEGPELRRALSAIGNKLGFGKKKETKKVDPKVSAQIAANDKARSKGGDYFGTQTPPAKNDTKPATPPSSTVASQQPSTSRPVSPPKNQGTGDKSAAAAAARQEAAKVANQNKSSTPSPSPKPTPKAKPTGPITSRAAIAAGSKEGQGPKSAASTYTGANDKTKVGRYKTLAQHRAAVAKTKNEETQMNGKLSDWKEDFGLVEGDMKQARKNVGADTCWDGYKAKGTKKKGGKDVPNCVKEGETIEEKKGLWDNIHAKRKRGEEPAEKGDKDYPKTLNVEGYDKPDEKLKTDRDGYRVSDKEAAAAKERIKEKTKKKKAEHDNRYSDGTGEESKKKKADLEKKRGMKLDGHPEFTRDDYSFYDICLSYLDENYILESVEEAEEVMMQLTGAQIVEIIDEFMNDPSVVEQKATAVDGHGNTYRDYNNDGLSDRQKRMKKFGDKRAAMLVKGV